MESSCCHGGFRPKHWLLLIIALGAIALGVLSIIRERIVNPPQYQVTFTGHGRVFAKPDIAQATLGVRTDRRPTAVLAVTENTEKMNQVIAKVKELGIEDKDIKTTSYNLSPEYDYNQGQGRSILAGYSVYQEVTLKIRNLDDIGKVIEATTTAGANQVGNIAFTIDDTDELKKQARAEAIAKAKVRAEEVTQATGIRLGKLVNVYENDGSVPLPYYDYSYAKMEGLGMGGASPAPAIQTGENEVTLDVTLVYEVK